MWIGATGEFERAVNGTVTSALNKAAREFASDEFADAVLSQETEVMDSGGDVRFAP